MIAAASVGGILAGSVGYAIGTWGGLRLIRRYGRLVRIGDARLAWARRSFRERGAAASLLARFLARLRILVPMLAGLAEMPFGRFSAYNAVGAVGSAVVYGTLGYLFGRDLAALEHHLALTTALVVALALMVGMTMAVRWRRERRRASARSATILLLICACAATTGCGVFQREQAFARHRAGVPPLVRHPFVRQGAICGDSSTSFVVRRPRERVRVATQSVRVTRSAAGPYYEFSQADADQGADHCMKDHREGAKADTCLHVSERAEGDRAGDEKRQGGASDDTRRDHPDSNLPRGAWSETHVILPFGKLNTSR